jgi:hypothetical protein
MPRARHLLTAVALFVGTRTVHADTVTGTVESVRASWSGEVIVTEADIVQAGTRTHVVQLGGVVDGVGMVFSHQPSVLAEGDAVMVDVRRGPTGDGRPAAAIERVRSRIALRPAGPSTPGIAVYGLQRTNTSGRTLWRDSGCIELSYDDATVTPAIAPVLDRAFGSWVDAVETAKCGGLSITRVSAHGVPAAADGISTVRVRSDRWCRPATSSAPEFCYPPEVAAITRLVYTDMPGIEDDGRIVEADMELNAVTFTLLLPGEAPPADTNKPALYLQAVATHEAGHLVGLAHDCGTGTEPWPTDAAGMNVPTCDGATSSVLASTMFFQVSELDDEASTLKPADIEGVCAIASHQQCEAIVTGGCSVASRTVVGSASSDRSPRGIPVLAGAAVALLLCRRRTQRRS